MADRTVVLSQNGRHAVRGLSVNNPSEFSAYQDDDDDLTYVVDLSAYLDGATITVVTRVPQGVFISNSSNTTTRLTQRLRGFGYVDFKVQTSAGDVEEFRVNILRRTGSKVVLGASGGGGTAVIDGNYGDVVVSGNGTVWTVTGGTGGATDVQTFDTVSAVNSATIDAAVNHIRTAGYSAAGDGGGGLYNRRAGLPSHNGYITSNSGSVIWELADPNPSVLQLGAVGNGIANDTTAFSNAVAIGKPVFVPKTSSFYALTSLTAAQQKMLFGPGVVKVSGTQVQIPSESFVNNDIGQVRAVNQDCQPSKWPGVDGSLFNSGFVAQIKRTGGWPSYGGCYFGEYLVSASITTNEYEFGLSCFTTSQNLTGGGIFGGWLSSNTPASSTYSGGALSHTFSSGRCTGLEINSGNRWAEFGLLNDIGNTREVTGLKVVPDVGPSPDFSPNFAGSTPIYHGTFGVCIADSIWGHKWQTGLLVSENAVAPSGRIMNIIGGSSVGNAAAVLLRATGHINAGIDLSGTTMTGNAFRAGSCGTALISAGTMTRGIDFSGATISGQGILFNNDQNVQWVGGAQFSGNSTGAFGLSTATTSGVGTLYANGFAVENLRWGISGGAATIGFLGATAIVRPASANQAALTNSTGGTRDGTLADVGATYNQATLNNNFTDLHVLVNEIRTALVNLGLMKGSA